MNSCAPEITHLALPYIMINPHGAHQAGDQIFAFSVHIIYVPVTIPPKGLPFIHQEMMSLRSCLIGYHNCNFVVSLFHILCNICFIGFPDTDLYQLMIYPEFSIGILLAQAQHISLS